MRKSLLLLPAIILWGSGISLSQAPDSPLLKDLRWRNIGPANMQGRVTDIEALDKDYRFVLVASASGGVFKSLNAGTTWEPIFDKYGSASMGDIAVYQKDAGINRFQWDLRFDPNSLDREITQLIQKLRGMQSEGDRQRLLDEGRARLMKIAENESQRQEIARRIESATSFDPETGAGMGGGMRESQGMMAGPGVYRITLAVAGKTYTTTLTVRMDPLLDELSKKQ